MLRSLYSGISGMKVNQTKLDVIGNNIANVGTTSFKSSRVRFQDMLSQNVSQALAPGLNQGGINPKQVGLGVQMAGIDTIVTQGMMQPTSRNLDVAVDGEGYFMVGSGPVPMTNDSAVSIDDGNIVDASGMNISYTRDGSFTLDEEGNLLTSDGYRVLGYAMNMTGGVSSVNYQDGRKTVNFINVNDLSAAAEGNSLVPLVIPDKVSVPASNFAQKTVGGTTITPTMEFSGGDKAYADLNMPTVLGSYTGTQNAEVQIINRDGYWFVKTPLLNNGTEMRVASGDQTVSVAGVNITLPYAQPAPVDPADPTSGPTAAQKPTKDTIWTQNLYAENTDGVRVKTFNIDKAGIISAVLEDGTVSALGQIAMSSFKNPAGLTKLGKNIYAASPNSGEPIVRSGAGTDGSNTGGYGDMLQGMLEMSNVDLAEQFTDMIVTSRAFQANSKTISTGDEILQEILNLKR